MTATAVQEALTGLASADKQQQLQRYFKTGPGQYGEGDVFIGVTVPQLRAVAKQYKALPFSELKLLITSLSMKSGARRSLFWKTKTRKQPQGRGGRFCRSTWSIYLM